MHTNKTTIIIIIKIKTINDDNNNDIDEDYDEHATGLGRVFTEPGSRALPASAPDKYLRPDGFRSSRTTVPRVTAMMCLRIAALLIVGSGVSSAFVQSSNRQSSHNSESSYNSGSSRKCFRMIIIIYAQIETAHVTILSYELFTRLVCRPSFRLKKTLASSPTIRRISYVSI